jgi:hypothetical protein
MVKPSESVWLSNMSASPHVSEQVVLEDVHLISMPSSTLAGSHIDLRNLDNLDLDLDLLNDPLCGVWACFKWCLPKTFGTICIQQFDE